MKKNSGILLAISILFVFFRQAIFAQSDRTYYQVTVNVTLSTGFAPVNVEVRLNNNDIILTDSSGTVVFDSITGGSFYLTAFKTGYDLYVLNNPFITEDKVFNIFISESKYPPTGQTVDPLTLRATWNEPLLTELDEDFEDPVFPPAGWQALSLGQGCR
jgi:hypothetical protein